MNNDIEVIAGHANKVLSLASAQLGEEYYYQSLPLCVIDAIYSIGVRYEGVENTVERYCGAYNLRRIRTTKGALPPIHEQESVSAFCEKAEQIGSSAMAMDIFRNRQRTSPRNGILKADAVYRFAIILKKHNIEYLQDISGATDKPCFVTDILSIPGQASGISLQYFSMLTGSDEFIKPDRMILAYLKSVLGRTVCTSEAQELLAAATELLKVSYQHLTPRLLDHEIWKYQRDQVTP